MKYFHTQGENICVNGTDLRDRAQESEAHKYKCNPMLRSRILATCVWNYLQIIEQLSNAHDWFSCDLNMHIPKQDNNSIPQARSHFA